MKIFLLFFIVTMFAILQSSFFIHFPIYGLVPNLLLALVLIYNLLEDFKRVEGFYIAVFAGFWVDVFSTMPIGTYVVSFLFLAYLLKRILRRYVEFTVS